MWYSINGERLGTYDGHCGAVWCLDPKWDTTHLVTGAADNTVRLWDIQTGKELSKIDTKSAVRTANFSFSGNLVSIEGCEGKPVVVTMLCPRSASLQTSRWVIPVRSRWWTPGPSVPMTPSSR